MDIKSCRFCKKAFRGFSSLCPTCAEQLDQKYILVRNYLDRDRSANVMMVAQETGVDEKSILYLIREGRIALLSSDGTAITCLKCGAAILSGRYCDKCKSSLMQDLNSTKNAMAASAASRKPEHADGKNRIHIKEE